MDATATARTQRGATIVRRYCSCDFTRVCRCGLPATRSGWTVESLAALKRANREHGSLSRAAAEVGEPLQRTNIALEALLGRTPAQALAALEARAAREKYEAEKAATLEVLTSPVVLDALSMLRMQA